MLRNVDSSQVAEKPLKLLGKNVTAGNILQCSLWLLGENGQEQQLVSLRGSWFSARNDNFLCQDGHKEMGRVVNFRMSLGTKP